MLDVQKVKIGSRIEGYGGQIMVVTKILKNSFVGYSEYCYEKFTKKKETMSLIFSTIKNPHYSKYIKLMG